MAVEALGRSPGTAGSAVPGSAVRPVDVDVRAPTGTTAGQLAVALARELQVGPSYLQAGRHVVPEAALVGHPPLLHGAAISLVEGEGAPAGARTVPATPAPRRTPRQAPFDLVVTAGPDAGRRFPLLVGRHLLGRGAGVDLQVHDPGLSRVHAVLSVGPERVCVADHGSTNGLHVDGSPVPHHNVVLGPRREVDVAHSILEVRPRPMGADVSMHADGRGHLLVNRAPRSVPRRDPVTIRLPRPPEERRGLRLPWLAMLLPLPVCAVLALLMGPQALLFSLMTPVLMAGNAFGDRITGRREYAGRLADYERATALARTQVHDACARERTELAALLPDAATIEETARGAGLRLWERRAGDPDFLTLRLGTGTVPASVTVLNPSVAAPPREAPDLSSRPDPAWSDDGAARPTLARAPVGVDVDRAQVLGLAGPTEPVMAMLRCLVGQVATLHSPCDVRLAVLAPERHTDPRTLLPTFVRLLPHALIWDPRGRSTGTATTCSLDDMGAGPPTAVVSRCEDVPPAVWTRADGRTADPGGANLGGTTLVLLLGSRAQRGSRDISRLLAHGPAWGVRVIAVDRSRAELPVECNAVVEVHPSGVAATLELPGEATARDFTPDGTAESWLERVVRSLARLRDATPGGSSTMPDRVRLPDLLGAQEVFDAGTIARRWAERSASTRAVLGRSAQGTYSVDLATDGPHILVGGTTGSGKSELLQTLVVSLALANSPEELSLVLVDYKGGSAFSRCRHLPHTVGFVTDLDEHLGRRALVSLGAELSYRERLLARLGAANVDEYRRRRGPGDEVLGRLVVVIDEFRALAEDLPGVMEGLVHLASVGRSLGVHLVLATQRPAGVVSADIKANVNLRIALRVRDRADSEDVVDAPDAALIPQRLHGRAVARTGGDRLSHFQTAWLGACEAAADSVLTVTRLEPSGAPSARSAPTADSGAEGHARTDLDRIVEALRHAAVLAGCRAPRRLWHAPLPAVVAISDMETAGEGEHLDAVWGLADEPMAQRQRPFTWSPRVSDGTGGHWVVGGSGGSGRTSALRTLAWAAAAAHSPDRVHIYAVDGSSGGLGPLASLPHTGSVVPRTDFPRVVRLVKRLAREVARRQALLAEAGHASLDEWLAAPDTVGPGQEGIPAYLLLLVDDFDLVVRDSEQWDHGQTVDALVALLRDGASAGLRAAVSGDRTVLIGRSTSWASHRLALRLTDPADAALLGLSWDVVPRHPPPGRGVVTATGLEVQIAHLGHLPDATSAAEAIRLLASRVAKPHRGPAFRVTSLPQQITRCELGDSEGLAFAVGGEDGGTVSLDFERHGRQVLIAGPPRSGVSTALRAVATAACVHDLPVVWVSPRHPDWLSTWSTAGRAPTWFGIDRVDALAEVCRGYPHPVVVVDQVDRLADTSVESVLREVRRAADRGEGAIICGGSSPALSGQFRGLAVEVARTRVGVLLGPRSRSDGDLLGVRLPPSPAPYPGRGVFVCGEEVTEIQVALPVP